MSALLRSPILALALLASASAQAGSCCGGGSGANVLLPKTSERMVDLTSSAEIYDGQWNRQGKWEADPAGSDLRQYRLSVAGAWRLADNWQASAALPYAWNRNHYNQLQSNTSGLSDAQLSLWYETFDNPMCVYKVRSPKDLQPAIYLGLGLTVPTGVSPYDDVKDNFDITGRGFYRLDTNLIVDKTIYPWTAALQLGWGYHFERDVNRDNGTWVEPYRKQLGQRRNASLSVGYVIFDSNMNEFTTTLGLSQVEEDNARVNDIVSHGTSFMKRAANLAFSWSSMDKDWVIKTSWSHAIQGTAFPATDIYSFGVSHAF
ncbi:MAG: hypothetical protein OEW58_08360 [Gammaproteobacteria bacterium]|nr:hypothetical protein [Gammaproteobacteria bacterium]